MKNEAVEAATAAVASKSTYAGAGSMIVGWMLSNEFVVLLGMVVGVAGLLINWYYKAKADRRSEQLYALRVERIKGSQRGDSDLAELGVDE
ncbi:hypothetical protein VAPA_1c17220 [Variovorax paradoxus B4]|uniref:Holin n=1 Tax=Variovorax paradoxus B4 TaxID=1246301 RepID=T1X9I1_VARPD|nr:holin [Variovorax paradoxus]AGU48830.1 hypothetical protein VAPA_1c17220 [Variovorax paradoxus B4]